MIQDTSREANESIKPHKPRIDDTVWDAIRLFGKQGMTCDEIEVGLNGRHQTISAAVNRLMNVNRIYNSGLKRPTRSGRKAIVWVVGTKADANGQGKLL